MENLRQVSVPCLKRLSVNTLTLPADQKPVRALRRGNYEQAYNCTGIYRDLDRFGTVINYT